MYKESSPFSLPELSDPRLDDMRVEVLQSLELDAGRYPNREATWKVVNGIVQGVWLSTFRLRIPPPRYGLIHDWEEDSPEDSKGRKVIAQVTNFTDNTSLMSFSPSYLNDVLDHFSGERILRTGSFLPRQIAIHEMRHIWQNVYHPEKLRSDLEKYGANGLDGWLGTESERDALSYAAAFEGEVSVSHLAQTNIPPQGHTQDLQIQLVS